MSQRDRQRRRTRAFTLVELLIVISIIAILISLLFVGYPKINTLLKERTCQGNLRSIGQILLQYCQRNRGFYPDSDGYYGASFQRNQCWGNPHTGPAMPAWTALSNADQLREMGATEAMFTCPFAIQPSGSVWWGTWDTPILSYDNWNNYYYYQIDLQGYTLIFGRGNGAFGDNTWSDPLRDGRPTATTNACKGNMPIVADLLYARGQGAQPDNPNGGPTMSGGWYHGGGLVTAQGGEQQYGIASGVLDSSVSPGFNNAACNTLFAGGYVVHSEPGDFQDANGKIYANGVFENYGLQLGSDLDTWWFALQPKAN